MHKYFHLSIKMSFNGIFEINYETKNLKTLTTLKTSN